MDLERRVAAALAALGVDERDLLAVACSGGADSIALAHLVAGRGVAPVLLHVDHGLRDDSRADADLVRRVAERLGLGFVERCVSVEPVDGSVEAGARLVRYIALEEMAQQAGAPFVATGHTLDDQAETVVLRLMRGGGLDAIAPIWGCFVRPLLDVRRDELRGWLTQREITWREDPTNTDERFERNWVRKKILPLLEERRAGVASALASVARQQRADRDALDAFAADVFSRALIDDVGVFLPNSDLEPTPPAVASRVIRSAFRHLGTDPTQDAVESVREMSSAHVRYGEIDVWQMPDGIAFVGARRPPQPIVLPETGCVESMQWGIKVRVGVPDVPAWRWRAHVPADNGALTIRGRRPGDRVTTRAGTKKISDVLIDAKVPRPLRGLVPILDIDGGAHAVVGYCGSRGTADGSARRMSRSDPLHRAVDIEPFHPTWSRERAWISP